MHSRIFIPFLCLAFILSTAVVAFSQDPDEEEVRGSFLTSRSNKSSSSSNASANATVGVSVGIGGDASANTGSRASGGMSSGTSSRNTATGRTTSSNKSTGKGGSKGTKTGTGKGQSSGDNSGQTATNSFNSGAPGKTLSSRPIALGYTIFMLDNNGEAVSVDPSHRFRAGDRVRIFLETNTDGYLYIFHTENGGNPQMIFPDARLNAGENFIGAHVPTEIPSSLEPDERLRWFVFDQNPATERLYVVVTRTPLPLIPTGQNLISYCRANQGNCPWRPVPEMWAQFQAKVNVNTRTVKAKSYGQAQTARQRESATRGLGLDQSAPPPSIIRMNATSNAPVLITALDLIHR